MQHRNKTPADTEKEIQTKFKYPAETPAHAAKIPRQMSLFIQQDQITSSLKITHKHPQHEENTTHLYPRNHNTQGSTKIKSKSQLSN
jgi:hypothetical protein